MPTPSITTPAPTSRSAHAVSFNEDWLFLKNDAEGAQEVGFDDGSWRQETLPHDWAIEGPFDAKYNARTGGLPCHGTGWYRKHFKLDPQDKDKRFAIEFDGAMYDAHIWINGVFLGNRPFGYIGFEYDLTEHLNFGDQDNVIAVRLQPEDLSSRWYPGAGLYRNVWLKKQNPLRIPHWGTFLTTPTVTDEWTDVRIKTTVVNDQTQAQRATLVTTILDEAGQAVTTHKMPIVIEANGSSILEPKLVINNPKRWNIQSPYRYTAITTIEQDGNTLDTYTTPFGVRTINYSPAGGFELNGRRVQLQGVCLHHDLGPLGAAVNQRAIDRQLEIMQSMGVNAIRTSHNPPAPELLEACDRMGFVVQVESFDCWEIPKVANGYNKFFKEWHERDLRDMIKRDRNHPCVIMWSIGNEILEQNEKDGWIIARKLHNICRDEDPTRLTSAGFNIFEGAMNNGLAAEVDLPGFNYHPAQYQGVLEKHPDWIIMGSETSSCTSSRGVYHLPIDKYTKHESKQVTSYDIIGPPWAYPPDIEFHYLEQNPRVLGEFIWTGIDYLGEPTPYGGDDNNTHGYWNDDWPSHSSYFAPVDLCGLPKDRFYLYQSQWTDTPMVHVLPHWNWPGMEGEMIPVYAFSNCEETELFVNGESQGRKKRHQEPTPITVDFYAWPGGPLMSKYRMHWNVPYAPGSIKVVGYVNGQPVCEKTIATAQNAATIDLKPDRTTITADGKDLSFITVSIQDVNGNLCPTANDLVRFKIKGPAHIAAIGNGDATSTEPFQTEHCKAFSGKCVLIIKSQKAAVGEIHVTAESDDLETNTLTITSS